MTKPGPDPKVTDEEIIQALREGENPYATAKDISERVDLSRTRASQRLKRLSDEGEIEKGSVSGRVNIYWLEDESF